MVLDKGWTYNSNKVPTDAIVQYIQDNNGIVPKDLSAKVDQISKLGGTPLVVCADYKVLGVIYLKDTVKPGLIERFERLRKIGIKTIMCTGDNRCCLWVPRDSF